MYPSTTCDHICNTWRPIVWCPGTIYDDVSHTGTQPMCCPNAILDDNLHKRPLCTTDADHHHGSPLMLIGPPFVNKYPRTLRGYE